MTDREDAQLNDLIASTTFGTSDDAAALAAFAGAIGASLKLPMFGLVIGERVQVDGVELAGMRRGIVAKLRKGGRSRQVSLLDVVLPGQSRGALLVRAYQRWAGSSAALVAELATAEPQDDAEPSATIDAVVLKLGSGTARLRPVGEDQEITLRGTGSDMWNAAPGQIVTIRVSKRWTHRRYLYMSGKIEAARIDIEALDLRPLGVLRRGPQTFELERVVPDARDETDRGVLERAIDLHALRDHDGAEKILMDLLHADLRCLDAHALLGEWAHEATHEFMAKRALPHFEIGVGIGNLALGPTFDGRLPWGFPGNQPFLRCLYGCGMALWRFGRAGEAAPVFERLRGFDLDDSLGAGGALTDLKAGLAWSEHPVDP